VIFVNLLTYFNASQSPSNGLTLCFLVTVSFPATTLASSHSSLLFLTFVFSPWDLYSLGHSKNNNSLYSNQVDNRNLLQWHTKQAATQDSTAVYNRTQSFGTQAFKSTIYNTSLARSVRLLLSARCPQCRNLINTNRNNKRTHTLT